MLKIVNLAENCVTERRNLRFARANLNYSTNDLRWHPSPACRHLIAAAATNRNVVLYDLARMGQGQRLVQSVSVLLLLLLL